MPTVFYIVIAVVVAIIAIVICSYIAKCIYRSSQGKYKKFVLQNSAALKRLNEINQRYKFYPYINFDQSYTYDNEKLFDNISCEDYLIYQLQYVRNDVFNQIKKVNMNKQEYEKYLDEIKSIDEFGQFDLPIGKLKVDRLKNVERYLFEEHKRSAPITQFYLTVTLCCSKINGVIYDRKSAVFYGNDIYKLSKRLSNKSGSFYNDREIWDALCRVERGKVSNKLRFAIYDRDGHRCCKCGVSDRYEQLEIDHIIPISKGGKTTYNNLQTLCHRCNVEKGDSLYY